MSGIFSLLPQAIFVSGTVIDAFQLSLQARRASRRMITICPVNLAAPWSAQDLSAETLSLEGGGRKVDMS